MTNTRILTNKAPVPIGPYSQAIRSDRTVYLASQAPFVPGTMEIASGGIEGEARQVLENLKAVATEAGGSLADVVKVTVFLTDLDNFPLINQLMGEYFKEPYPARTTVGVVAMPKGTQIGIDCMMVLSSN